MNLKTEDIDALIDLIEEPLDNGDYKEVYRLVRNFKPEHSGTRRTVSVGGSWYASSLRGGQWSVSELIGYITKFMLDAGVDVFAEMGEVPPYALYKTDVKSVLISNKVTRIGSYAFAGCNELEDIKINPGQNLIEIDKAAFANCVKLQKINLPDTIRTIGTKAFFNCAKLENLELPSLVNEIGSYAFAGCRNLNNFTWNGTHEEFESNVTVEQGNESALKHLQLND